MILNQLQSRLKPLTFRKSGPTFTRDVGDVIHIVNLQKSTASDSRRVEVTINIGVWVKILAPVRVGVPDKANVWSAHWRERIGHLSPERVDRWWSAATIDEAVLVGRELSARIAILALPKFEHLSSLEAVIALWQSGHSPGLTVGQRDRYLTQLTKVSGLTPS